MKSPVFTFSVSASESQYLFDEFLSVLSVRVYLTVNVIFDVELWSCFWVSVNFRQLPEVKMNIFSNSTESCVSSNCFQMLLIPPPVPPHHILYHIPVSPSLCCFISSRGSWRNSTSPPMTSTDVRRSWRSVPYRVQSCALMCMQVICVFEQWVNFFFTSLTDRAWNRSHVTAASR